MRHLPTRCSGFFGPLFVISALLAAGCSSTRQQTFECPDEAVDALVQAVRNWSPDRISQILGPEGDDILSSGDEVADRNAAERFAAAFDEKHQLVTEREGYITLVVGNNDWPMPIPIVRDARKRVWYFDSEIGKDEIVNRRIGRNELDVIEVCQAIVDAQKEYMLQDPDSDGVREYAQSFLSEAGKKNGLYWPTGEGEQPSPLGPLVAAAVEEGYGSSPVTDQPRPYHGYCYRMLTAQGASASGGSLEYKVDGRLINGFAAVAYPAEYGNSGIMTFMVSHQGVVYQMDLGPDTAQVAKAMVSFDPGPGWQVVVFSGNATAAMDGRP